MNFMFFVCIPFRPKDVKETPGLINVYWKKRTIQNKCAPMIAYLQRRQPEETPAPEKPNKFLEYFEGFYLREVLISSMKFVNVLGEV